MHRHRFLVACLMALITPTVGATQGTGAAAECAGGPPGPRGFLLAKASLSASLMAATQHQATFASQLITVQNWHVGPDNTPTCGRWYQRTLQDLSVSYDGKRSAAGAMTITRNLGGMFQHMFFLKSNASYAYLLGDLYHNNSLGLELRQAYGAGAGYARNAFELHADVRFMHQKFLEISDPARLVGIGLGARYDLDLSRLLSGGTLSVGLLYVPVLNHSESWFADGTSQLVLPFNEGRWGLVISAQNNYLRNAPPKFARNYTKASVGLAYNRK